MEAISLTLNSPRIPLAGLDDAIGKLERVEELLGTLQKVKGFSINLHVTGTDAIDAATANINGLKGALREVGMTGMAEKLERGLVTAGEVARSAQSEIRKLSHELEQATVKSVQMQGKFEELHTTSRGNILNFTRDDKMTKLRGELNAAIGEVETLQNKMAALQRISGFGQGVSGTPAPAPAAPASIAASGALAVSAARQSAAAQETVASQREGLNITRQQLESHRKLFELSHQVAQQHQAINAPQLGIERVVTAYRELTAESGHAAVSISDLQRRSGVAMKEVQEWIRKQRTAGRASLIEGDWAKATDEMREAAMRAKIGRKMVPHMLVEVGEPGMQKLGGPTVGLSQQSRSVAALDAAARAAEALGGAEQKLIAPAVESAAALKHQEEIVRSKFGAMTSLNGVTEKQAVADKKLAKAAEEAAVAAAGAAVAEARAGEVSRRTLRDRTGRVRNESVTYNQGPGDTVTTMSGGLTSQSINQLAKYRDELGSVRSEFASKRMAMSQAGFEKNAPEMLSLLRQEAAARQEIVDKMAKQGLAGEAMFKNEVLRIKATEEAASRQQQINETRRSQGIRSDVGGQLDAGFRERIGSLDREISAQKQLNLTKQEQVALLRQQSSAYGELSNVMRASGRGGTPADLGARKRSQVMEARAGALEAEIFQDTRAGVRASMDTGFREHAAMLDREYATLRAGLSTRQEEIALLKKEAQAYRELSDAMMASSRSGAPGQLTALRKSEVKGAQAAAMEAELVADRQRIAGMSTRFQAQAAAFGGKQTRGTETEGPTGKVQRTRMERDDPNGMRESITLTRRWNTAGEELVPTLEAASASITKVGRSATSAGKSMLDNIVTVTAWAAAVGVLYKSMALLNFGAQSMAKLEFQSARLSAVFRGTNEQLNAQSSTVMALRDQTLQLAAANGRGGEEAIEAAISWSRLGLSQTQVLEAVDVSLKAANVAEISTAEAAQQLSAVFAAYRLQVSELRTVLNELNSVSNNYNVTNKDLLGGLSRTSAIAKQAGLGLAELLGIIGSGVGRTGRSGAEIGNAVKAIIVAISNPKIQDMLDKQFDFHVKDQNGEMKDFSTTLNELYGMFQKLNSADQGAFLQKIGGKLQASRLQALMEGYVTGQMLAIKAQRDLSSAENENEKIRATALSQLQSLSTAFQRLSVNILTVGGDMSVARQFTALIQLISNLIGLMANWPALLVMIIAIVGALGVKIAAAMAKGASDTGILGRTIGHVRSLWLQFGEAVAVVNGQLATHNALAAKAAAIPAPHAPGVGASPGAKAAGGAVGLGGGALAWGLARGAIGAIFSKEFLVFTIAALAVEGVMKGLNMAFEHFSSDSDKAAKKLGEYNDQLERTKALHGAANEAARLAKTIATSIPKINERDPLAARQAIEDFAQISYSPEEDPTGRRREETRVELQHLRQVGDLTGLRNRFLQEGDRLAAQGLAYGKTEAAQKRAALEVQNNVVSKLQAEMAMRRRSGQSTIEVERQITEAQKTFAEKRGEAMRAFTPTDQEGEDSVPEDVKDFKADTKERFKKMGEVMDDMPYTSEDHQVEKVERAMEVERRRLELLKAVAVQEGVVGAAAVAAAQQKYDAAQKAYTPAYRKLAELRDAVQEQDAIDEALRTKAQTHQSWSSEIFGTDGTTYGPGVTIEGVAPAGRWTMGALDAVNEKYKKEIPQGEELKAALDAEEAVRQKIMEHQIAKTAAMEKEIKLQEKNVEDGEKLLKSAREYAELQDAISEGKRKAKQESVQFQTGSTETERLINEARGIGSLNGALDDVFAGQETGRGGWMEKHARKEAESRINILERHRDLLDHHVQSATSHLKFNGATHGAHGEIGDEGPVGQAGAAAARLSGLLGQVRSERDEAIAKGDKVGETRAEAEILQLNNRLSEIGVSLEERRYQLARDIVNERRREAEEASKALLTAGREEQLRAALVKRFTQANGTAFTAEQFQFLDKGTQEAVTKFNPESAPAELKGRASDLEGEQRILLDNLEQMGHAIKEVTEEIKGMQINITPVPPAAPTVPAVAQIQPPDVNLQFAAQYQQMIQITTETVAVALRAEIASMQAQFNIFAAGFKTASAQSSGANSLAS